MQYSEEERKMAMRDKCYTIKTVLNVLSEAQSKCFLIEAN